MPWSRKMDFFMQYAKKDDEKFIHTKLSRKAERLLDSSHSLLIIGHPEQGTGTLGKHLFLKYAEDGYTAFRMDKARDWNSTCNPKEKQVVFFQNAFGLFPSSTSSHAEQFSSMGSMIVSSLEQGNIKVIATSTRLCYVESKYSITESKIFKHIIDLNDEEVMDVQDKVEFLKEMCAMNGIGASRKTLEGIASKSYLYRGFPRLCKNLEKVSNTQMDLNQVQRIILLQAVQEMRELTDNDTGKSVLLCILMLLGGKATRDEIKDMSKHKDITSILGEYSHLVRGNLENMEDVYFTVENDSDVTMFPLTVEAVFIFYSKMYSRLITTYLKGDFFWNKITIVPMECYEKPTDNTIPIKEDQYESLLRILLEHASDNNIREFLKSSFSKETEFMDVVRAQVRPNNNFYLKSRDNKYESRNSLLHLCVLYGAEPMSSALLEHCESSLVKATNAMHDMPLHLACREGHLGILKSLIRHRAEVNAVGSRSQTPLHMACEQGHVETVEYLLKYGADRKCCDADKFTPLHLAAESGNLRIVELLLSRGTKVKDLNRDVWQPLHFAASGGHIAVVRALLKAGSDVSIKDEQGLTALHLAAQSGSLESVKMILSKGADVNAQASCQFCVTALHAAVITGSEDIVRELLARGSDANIADENGFTPLHLACCNGHPSVVSVLLEHGVSRDAQDKHGRKALHCAAYYGHDDVMEVLLNAKFDPSEITGDPNVTGTNPKRKSENSGSKGYSSMHLAALGGHVAAVRLLLESKADVNYADKDGWTSFHTAIDSGHLDLVCLMFRFGADVNATTIDGSTPLHIAVDAADIDIIQALVDVHANIRVVNGRHQTPLQLAEQSGLDEAVEIFQAEQNR